MAAAIGLVAVSPLLSWGGGAPTGDDLKACKPQVNIGADGWARISTPTYATGEGEDVIAAFAASPNQPGYLYATNGKVVQASIDAGCKWSHIHPAPAEQQTPDVAGTVITQLVAPLGTSLWMAAYDSSGGVPRPHVYRTNDATPGTGNTTKEAVTPLDDGLPVSGTPVELLVAPGNAKRAFLLMEEPVDAASASTTAKRFVYRLFEEKPPLPVAEPTQKWQRTTLPTGLGQLAGLTQSPAQMATIWTWSGAKYAVSRDSGATWKTGTAQGTISTIDVDNYDVASIYSAVPDGSVVERIQSNGKKDRQGLPIAVTAATHGSRVNVRAVTGPKGTYGYDLRAQTWTPITPTGTPRFSELRFGATRGGGRILLGQTEQAIYRFDLFPGEAFLRPPQGVDYVDIGGWIPTPGMTVPVVTPAKRVVTVAPGEVDESPADFGVPPSATPLDVFFLIDSTMSMSKPIEAMKLGVEKIAEQLKARTRGEACFGVGDIKDFGVGGLTTGANPDDVRAYHLVQPITCDLGQLKEAVKKVKESGGDNVPEEAQTIALTQAVTGKGQTQPPVPARQDAHFRGVGSNGRPPMRVIVLITDAGFKMEPSYRGFPSMEETAKTLNAYNKTKVVGVAVSTQNDPIRTKNDLSEIARLTDTVAPPNGVDCNGDKKIDILGGDPLVCETDNEVPQIAPAIVNLLLGVKDPGTIALNVEDPHGVVRGIESDGASVVGKRVAAVANLKVENHLTLTPSLSCTEKQDGKDLPVKLLGTIRGSLAAEGEIVVRCRAPKIVVPPPPKPPKPPVVIQPEPPLPPLIRPMPVPIVVPQFQPPAPNNPISNLNPNAGFSQQEEEQMQLATVGQDAGEQQDDSEEFELAMSSVASEDAAAAGLVFGCATMVSAAAGVMVVQRRRTQRSLRPAYVRRRD